MVDLGPPERCEGGPRRSVTADHIHLNADVQFWSLPAFSTRCCPRWSALQPVRTEFGKHSQTRMHFRPLARNVYAGSLPVFRPDAVDFRPSPMSRDFQSRPACLKRETIDIVRSVQEKEAANRGGLMLARATRRATNSRFPWISSDRPARPRADERDRKRGTRMFGCQSPTGRGWSGPGLFLLCTLDMVACKT
jgi:hypothetical protein